MPALVTGCLSNQGNNENIKGNWLCLKSIREKLGNLGRVRDISGNIRENLCLCSIDFLICLKKLVR